MPFPDPLPFDYVLVGGGLQNALTALSLLSARPLARVALVERAARLGGNHVWCFHEGDIPTELATAVAPLCVRRWPSYRVDFPAFGRTVEQAYAAVTSERLDQVLRAAFDARPDCALIAGTAATEITSCEVRLADGRLLTAPVVMSALGPETARTSTATGWQKFLGLELELREPSPRDTPLLMDARVPQRDGFRFFYVLPFAPNRVLIEDTHFSGTPALDRAALRDEVLAYAARNGYVVARVLREEVGILPLPMRGTQATNPAIGGPYLAGFQGGWFHPTTGYSFPIAARLAALVASSDPARFREHAWPEHARAHQRQFRFYAFLNRLLFGCFAPENRYSVIERFYRLEEPTLRRFYAMSLTGADRARIFCARPPRGFSLRLALSEGTPS
jgi:lycopene beta-cyclase